MDVGKYQQFVESILKAAEMRKEIHDHLDKFTTARQMGYEEAKIKYKPLLEAQAAQTEAQKAQNEATKALVKPPTEAEQLAKLFDVDLTAETRLFIQAHKFPLPFELYLDGILSHKEGGQRYENWRQKMLDISVNLGRSLKKPGIPDKESIAQYQSRVKKIAVLITKQQTTPPTAPPTAPPTVPQITLPTVSTSDAATRFDKDITGDTFYFMNQHGLTLPSDLYRGGVGAESKGKIIPWMQEMLDLSMSLSKRFYDADQQEQEPIEEYRSHIRKVVDAFAAQKTPKDFDKIPKQKKNRRTQF